MSQQIKFLNRKIIRKVIALGVALPVAAFLVVSSASTPPSSVALDISPTATSSISRSLVAHPVTGAIPFTGNLKAKKRLAKIAAAKAKKSDKYSRGNNNSNKFYAFTQFNEEGTGHKSD